jgi:hypothetical protein
MGIDKRMRPCQRFSRGGAYRVVWIATHSCLHLCVWVCVSFSVTLVSENKETKIWSSGFVLPKI